MTKRVLFAVLVIGCSFIPFSSHAQAGGSITAGLGLPELLNVGLRVQFGQTQLGAAVGVDPWSEDESLALSGDFYYHFGGKSEFTSLRPWYGKAGLTFLKSQNEWKRNTSLALVPRVGREFNISSKFGIALEAGILVLLYDHEKTLKENPDSWFDLDLDFSGIVLPSGGINLFYRF